MKTKLSDEEARKFPELFCPEPMEFPSCACLSLTAASAFVLMRLQVLQRRACRKHLNMQLVYMV